MSKRIGEFTKRVGSQKVAGFVSVVAGEVAVVSDDSFSLAPEDARRYAKLVMQAADVAEEEKKRHG